MATSQEIQDRITVKETEVDSLKSSASIARSNAQASLQAINGCKDKCNSPAIGAGVKFSISINPDEMYPEDLSEFSGCCGSGSANNFPGCADASTCAGRFSDATTKLNTYHNTIASLEKAEEELDILKEQLFELSGNGNGNGISPGRTSWLVKNRNILIFAVIALILILGGIGLYKQLK